MAARGAGSRMDSHNACSNGAGEAAGIPARKRWGSSSQLVNSFFPFSIFSFLHLRNVALVDVAGIFWSGYQSQGPGNRIPGGGH